MNKLLLDDKPLIVLPSLAVAIGLNEAIILQQLHYWLQESTNIRDGYKWVYNTYEDWQKQFPFWSKNTIIRAVKSLENKNLVIVGNYNKLKIDNTKWYRINYEELERVGRPTTQNEQTIYSKWVDGEPNLGKPITREYTENTTESIVSEPNIYQFYEQSFGGTISPIISQQIEAWVNDTSEELVMEAIKIAKNKKKGWQYAGGILKQWAQQGIKHLSDLEKTKKNTSAPRQAKTDVWDAFQEYMGTLGGEEDDEKGNG